jgi:hypothetical protein
LLCREAGASASHHFASEVAHRLLRDDAAFTAGKRSLGPIDRGGVLQTGALTLFPKGQGFLHGVLFGMQAAAQDCLPGKRRLIPG